MVRRTVQFGGAIIAISVVSIGDFGGVRKAEHLVGGLLRKLTHTWVIFEHSNIPSTVSAGEHSVDLAPFPHLSSQIDCMHGHFLLN